MSTMNKKKKLKGMLALFPGMMEMSAGCARTLGLDKTEMEAAYALLQDDRRRAEDAMVSGGPKMSMHDAPGTDGVAPAEWSVVARESLKRWADAFANWGMFSTDVSDEFVSVDDPNCLPHVKVNLVDNTGEAAMDDFSDYNDRTDNSKVSSVEVSLHKFDEVVSIKIGDIIRGAGMMARLDSAMSRVANRIQNYFLSELAVGKTQGGTPATAISAITVPACGDGADAFNYGYANRYLSEAIQPRVNGMILNSEYYGALKAADRQSLTAEDLDMDYVGKVVNFSSLGTNAVGLLGNRRGAAIAYRPLFLMTEGYNSMQQLRYNDAPCALTVATYFVPSQVCMKVVVGACAGIAVADASAVKPLVTA